MWHKSLQFGNSKHGTENRVPFLYTRLPPLPKKDLGEIKLR